MRFFKEGILEAYEKFTNDQKNAFNIIEKFIIDTASDLIDKIYQKTEVAVDINCVRTEINTLIKNNNLRSIKRKIEDIVIAQYYTNINQ